MYNNVQYRDYYLRQLTSNKEKIDKLIEKKKEDGNIDETGLLKIEEQRFMFPLFDDAFGYNERFRSPW